MSKGRKPTPAIDRMLRRVREEDGCLVFTGAKGKGGHGRVGANGPGKRVALAHRIAWEAANGPVPDGLCVLHTCDNPPCVLLDHLYLGTQARNVADMDERGRRRGHPRREEVGTCRSGLHLWGPGTFYTATNGNRTCRACKAARRTTDHDLNTDALRDAFAGEE